MRMCIVIGIIILLVIIIVPSGKLNNASPGTQTVPLTKLQWSKLESTTSLFLPQQTYP